MTVTRDHECDGRWHCGKCGGVRESAVLVCGCEFPPLDVCAGCGEEYEEAETFEKSPHASHFLSLHQTIRTHVTFVLARTCGNVPEAALLLEIPARTLYRWVAKWRLG